MSYFLTKARLNTHFNTIQKHFKTPDLINAWLAESNTDYALVTESAFNDQFQMTANAAYVIKTKHVDYNLAIKIIQSTQSTAYCFDVFLMLAPQDNRQEFKVLASALNKGLESLRQSHNGDWIISDDELTLSVFK